MDLLLRFIQREIGQSRFWGSQGGRHVPWAVAVGVADAVLLADRVAVDERVVVAVAVAVGVAEEVMVAEGVAVEALDRSAGVGRDWAQGGLGAPSRPIPPPRLSVDGSASMRTLKLSWMGPSQIKSTWTLIGCLALGNLAVS